MISPCETYVEEILKIPHHRASQIMSQLLKKANETQLKIECVDCGDGSNYSARYSKENNTSIV